MKKLITSVLLLAGSLSFAQDNWDSVAFGGLNYSSRFYDLLPFNGKLYAASDTGYVTPTLYSSPTGDFGTWTIETGLSTFLQGGSEDLLSRLATDGTNLFIGSANYSGGFQAPQVYRFDGSTYKTHGIIPYAGQPYLYNDISAMEFFSATGAPDSIFAFVSNFNGMEIWKTSTTATSPTWVQSLQMAGSAEIVNDAIVFGGKMYAATCGDANGSFILRTTDGIRWDTVGYGGFGNGGNYAVKSFAIYNGELYAGTQNNTNGAELYKTTDGSSWVNVSLSSLGLGTGLRSISDLEVVGGRLFTVFKFNNGSYDFIRPFYSNNGSSFYTSGIGTDMQQTPLGSGFGELRVESFNGGVYTASNTNSNFGSLWRLMIPVASFGPMNASVCQYGTANYSNTSSNSTSAIWMLNGSAVSTSYNYSGYYPTPGTQTLQLLAYNGNIYDSVQYTFTVTTQPSLGVTATPSFTVCPGQSFTATASATGGTPPYSYTWVTFSPGYPDPSPAGVFTYAPMAPGSYTVSVTDANGCPGNSTNVFVGTSSSVPTDLFGNISYSGGPVTQGNVYILKYQPTYSGTDTVAVLPIQPNGDYFKSAVVYGQYLVKADPDITLFPSTISTYNGGFFRWDSAAPFLHGCSQTDTNNIQVLELPLQTGTATVSGTLYEDVGYGHRFLGPGGTPPMPFVPGGPIRGVDVKLGKNPGGGVQARTMSDTNGRFVFYNVPVGTYKIYVDIPNLPMDSTHDVTITAATDSVPNNDYWADSTQIYIQNTVGIASIKNNSLSLKVFPNPAKDKVFVQLEAEKEGMLLYELCDITGKKLLSNSQRASKGKNTIEINLNGLQPGVYLMNSTLNSARYVTRLVVME